MRANAYIVASKRTPFITSSTGKDAIPAHCQSALLVRNLLLDANKQYKDLGRFAVANTFNLPAYYDLAGDVCELAFGHALPHRASIDGTVLMGSNMLFNAISDLQVEEHSKEIMMLVGTDSYGLRSIFWGQKMEEQLRILVENRGVTEKIKNISKIGELYQKRHKYLNKYHRRPQLAKTFDSLARKFEVEKAELEQHFFRQSNKFHNSEQACGQSEMLCGVVDSDELTVLRKDSLPRHWTLEQLAAQKPIYEKEFGLHSEVTLAPYADGSSGLMLAGQDWISAGNHGEVLKVIGYKLEGATESHPNLLMHFSKTLDSLLRENELNFTDIDMFETVERSPALMLSLHRLINSPKMLAQYNITTFNRPDLLKINNLYGGALLIGHPPSASFFSCINNLFYGLKNGQRGIAALVSLEGDAAVILVQKEVVS